MYFVKNDVDDVKVSLPMMTEKKRVALYELMRLGMLATADELTVLNAILGKMTHGRAESTESNDWARRIQEMLRL